MGAMTAERRVTPDAVSVENPWENAQTQFEAVSGLKPDAAAFELLEAGRAGASWTNAPQASIALPGMGAPEGLVPIVKPEVRLSGLPKRIVERVEAGSRVSRD